MIPMCENCNGKLVKGGIVKTLNKDTLEFDITHDVYECESCGCIVEIARRK